MASKNASSNHSKVRTCLCSPTTHPGSFRCSIHRNIQTRSSSSASAPSNRWEFALFSAKANALKAFLLQIIKPSSHDLQRKRNFRPKPSRFCLMNGSRDGVAVS
ncbi:hypothetical protein Pint_14727 [Pistacia integerrima]|uniref:Uncharacterized protein n=1 Tax=Pistacia integerrima TaxID=434235 RepID=A0ACC0Y9K2_9ROSI|nr:hypothetical protein Pint_14727 [Pistacia integerrima]